MVLTSSSVVLERKVIILQSIDSKFHFFMSLKKDISFPFHFSFYIQMIKTTFQVDFFSNSSMRKTNPNPNTERTCN